ncbi:MAG TPA: DUF5693 family protein [Selenomonadales bacterium]|nr:DUF5693 family protein [Selenomonadales bacterium]
MANYKYNKILLALIVLGLVAALIIGWQRHLVEENNSRVEMVMDYDEIVELARIEGIAVPEAMRRFKEAGVTSLAVYDTTLEKFQNNGKLTVVTGADLLARYRTGEIEKPLFGDPDGTIDPNSMYLFVGRQEPGGPARFAEVKDDLARRLGPGRVQEFATADNRLAMAVEANFEKVLKWNLGLSSEEMQEVADNGFYIVVRPTNYTKVKPEDIDAVFDRLGRFPGVTGVMFAGEESLGVLGFPDLLPLTAKKILEHGLKLYMIENPLQLQFLRQEGLMPLATAANYQAARVYVIPKDEQPKLKLETAVHRWGGTDAERNIRVNLIRKYDKPVPGLTLLETNLKYVRDIKQDLIEKGFTLGPAQAYQLYYPSPWLLAVVIIGATAAGVLFLTLVWPIAPRCQYILLVLLAALLLWPVLKGSGTLVRQAAALVSASLFPVLAMSWQLDRWRAREPFRGSSLSRILVDGLVALLVTTGLAMVGGFYIGALLADVRFLLEMEIFRGVKLTFVMPLLLITLTYLVRYNPLGDQPISRPEDVARQVAKMLDYPIYLKTLLLFGLGAIAAWIYVGRSGHTAGVPVPAIEIKLRAFLEDAMYARPREKEFLIGHPAFMLAVVAVYRQWPRLLHYLLVVAATIGQGSLVETFAHIRTPIFMSFVRGVDGLLLGAALGILAVFAVQVLHYLSYLLGRRPAAHE